LNVRTDQVSSARQTTASVFESMQPIATGRAAGEPAGDANAVESITVARFAGSKGSTATTELRSPSRT
jgi:hypothetical protein